VNGTGESGSVPEKVKVSVKRALVFLLFAVATFASAQNPVEDLKSGQAQASVVTHLATALDHLSVLEFGETVTMAAAGSPAFQIERHEDKVFIKPLKSGSSTDLFIWTATRRFTYELEAPGEVKDMNFAVDNPAPAFKPELDSDPHMQEIADTILTKALLGAERIDSTYIKDTKGRVTLRIEHVFQASNTLYIHYAVHNMTDRPYRIAAPAVSELIVSQPLTSIVGLKPTQLKRQTIRVLKDSQRRAVPVARSDIQRADLQAGEDSHGIVAIREQISTPAVLQLVFGPEGKHPVEAVWVF
jgi:hypothetical protein